jgi:UDP-N-acetylglucosamine--N-acetylmuramyl-(pentapeptide) pyrophosphoryl-undecaprenol N-acetylglucosamine transferase
LLKGCQSIIEDMGMPPALRILMAGGATGGHLFPAIAIAEAFQSRNPGTKVLFVSIGNPFEKSVLFAKSYPLRTITVEGMKGRGVWRQIRSILKIPVAIFQSIGILRDYKPDLVIGVGSYAAGPLVISAWLMRKRVVLHEQNIFPGITNRLLAPFADQIFVSFQHTQTAFRSKKAFLSGNPVQKKILELKGNCEQREPNQSEAPRSFTVLVVGGSQGAHAVNLAVVEALDYLSGEYAYEFLHQTGEADKAMVEKAYRQKKMSSCVQAFFHDMERQYAKADLVICRAGATTVAEITAMGKPAIFIPFPSAADNHQFLNARALTEAGAAEMVLQRDLSGRTLSRKIQYYAANPNRLMQMSSKAKTLGRPEAAEAIVERCYQLLNT